jgi:putative acyl-CoA dehydrogenase
MSHGPEVVQAFLEELAPARAAEPRLDAFVKQIERDPRDRDGLEARARSVVERMAIALAGAILVRHGEPAVAEAYVTSRLAGEHGVAFGTLPRGTNFKSIIERATPAVG